MDIGCREVTRGDNNMVKFLLVEFISGIVMCRGNELSGCIVVNYPADSIVKADPVSAIGFLNPTFYVNQKKVLLWAGKRRSVFQNVFQRNNRQILNFPLAH